MLIAAAKANNWLKNSSADPTAGDTCHQLCATDVWHDNLRHSKCRRVCREVYTAISVHPSGTCYDFIRYPATCLLRTVHVAGHRRGSGRNHASMTLLEDLAAVTAADGLFAGFTVRRLCHLLDTLSRHDSMRLHADGRRTNRTQERMLERDFRFTHSLSPLQYKGLLTLYDGNDPQQHWAAMGDSLPELGSEAPPVVERYFQCEFGPECCGKTMRVGDIQAVAHTVGRSFAAKHIKKQCRGACGCTYYLNKKVYPEQLGNQAVKTHTFYPWNTREPEWIASKGGGTIISAALLTSFSIALCTMR